MESPRRCLSPLTQSILISKKSPHAHIHYFRGLEPENRVRFPINHKRLQIPYLPKDRDRYHKYDAPDPSSSDGIWFPEDGPGASTFGNVFDLGLRHWLRIACLGVNFPLGRFQIMVDRHPVIEDEAITLPETFLPRHQFHVTEDSAL